MHSEANPLNVYKTLSSCSDNHRELIKDQTVLLYIATVLDSRNEHVLQLCLDILTNLMRNPANIKHILDVYGVYENINALVNRHTPLPEKLAIQAQTILDHLHSVTLTRPPLSRRNATTKTYSLFHLFLADLSKFTRNKYENILLGTKGLVSFVMDVDARICIIRIHSSTTVKTVAENIQRITGIVPMIIIRNKHGIEERINPQEEISIERITKPADDSMLNQSKFGATVSYVAERVHQTKDTLMDIVNLWNKHFYW